MVPRTGPLSASSARATTSWYQRGKSSARGVSPPLAAPARSASGRARSWAAGYRVGPGAPGTALGGRVVGARRSADAVADAVDLDLGGLASAPSPRAGPGGRPRPRPRPPASAAARRASTPSATSSLGLVHQGLDHLVLGHDPDDLALDEQVTLRLRPAAMPRSASRASPGPLTTQPMTATWIGRLRSSSAVLGRLGHGDHVDLGPPARRAGDEVEALALAQAEGLEQLAARPGPPRPGRR